MKSALVLRVGRLTARLDRLTVWLEGYAAGLFVIRCIRIFFLIEARDRVLMLAGQGFIALVPLFMVVASLTSASGVERVGDGIIETMGLTGGAAEAVSTLFAYPPGAAGGITVFSLILLLFSLNGLAKSVQRTFEVAWGLPRMGMRGTRSRTLGLIVLLGCGSLAAWVSGLLDGLSAGLLAILAAQVLVIGGGWLVGTALMLTLRVPTRALVPGAVVSAGLQIIVSWATAIYIPEIFARNAERYGVMGVALALVTWLIAVTSVLVGGAIVGAVLGHQGDERPGLV